MKTTIKLLVLTLIIFFLLNSNDTKAQCNNDDWDALKALYENTNGDNWTNRTGWSELIDNHNSPPPNCKLNTLFGIATGNGRVTHINMDSLGQATYLFGDTIGNNLDGILPPEIGKLDSLKSLFIFHNNLSGSLPLELFNLGNLEHLGLRGNQLEGTIPPQIGSLQNLISLYIDRNNFSGNIPQELGMLSNLLRCRMGKNAFTGSIPSEIGNLSNLESLSLADNQLSGDIPVELYNLTNLAQLWLFQNGLTSTISPEIGKLKNLTHFSIFGNQLTGVIPTEIGNLSNLTWLSLSRNEFTGNLPIELGYLTNLTLLEIPGNNLYGCYPNNFTQFCTQLTDPEFDGNSDISDGNNFEVDWEDFCATEAGACCQTNCETDVYPGDLNHDGIVNNQDFGLSGLFLYEIGPPRATEHQNTEWYAHPANNWNRQQINNEDIKHFDCNGDGAITVDDRQAVIINMDSTWTTPLTQPPPDTSDYQIVLHPVDEMNNDLIHINVALESVNGGDLVLQGGHFTIDYGISNQNIINATLNFSFSPWIGVPNINLVTSVQNFAQRQTIEIGFTRTDGMDAVGSGVIGQLILQLDNSTSRITKQSDCMLNLEINTIGMHDSQPNNQPIENRLLQINMCESICKNTWSINDDTQFQNQYESNNLIETNGFLIIGDEQQVEYRANRVCLQAGFKVKAGANFRASYGSCN